MISGVVDQPLTCEIANVDLRSSARYAPYLARYRQGQWRDRILHDLIVEDIDALGRPPTVLDIGCGLGFDGNIEFQTSLASRARVFIGIEPDPAVDLGGHFTSSHRCLFEQAPIAPASVDVAYAIMVLEHIPDPQPFWDKLYDVLAPGGVFWGLTVDSRSPFAVASYWSEKLRVKDAYMTMLWGKRGEDRYLNYPVHYSTNSPRQLTRHVADFRSCEVLNFSRPQQLRGSFPRALWPIADAYDNWAVKTGRPGTMLAVRARK